MTKKQKKERPTHKKATTKIQEQMNIPKAFSYKQISTRTSIEEKYDSLVSKLSKVSGDWERKDHSKAPKYEIKKGVKNLKKRKIVEIDPEDYEADPRFFKDEEEYLPSDESYSESESNGDEDSDENSSDDDLDNFVVPERPIKRKRQAKNSK